MSFFDCVQRGMDGDEIDRLRGEYAQNRWKALSDLYEAQGQPRHIAEARAGEDVKEALKKEVGEKRHVYLAKMAAIRKMQSGLESSPDLKKHQSATVEAVDYEARGLVRRFNWRLGQFLKEHHRDLLGRVTKPAGMKNIVRELHGESSGDAGARAIADGIRDALEDMRLSFNEAGGVIGKLENWGLPHSHSRAAITRAGFDTWFRDISPRLDWSRIENRMTGRPFQSEGGDAPSEAIQRRFLKDIFDEIAFGRGSDEPVYGKVQGSALYKRHGQQRTLVFKGADDWIDYNKRFGSGDPMKSLMTHVHKMAREIAAMRNFGPNPMLGVDYQKQMAVAEARKRGDVALGEAVDGDGNRAVRMMRVEMGGAQPDSIWQDRVATFFSSARHVMTAAFLDRAVLASISDLNSMRLAASAAGLNPGNLVARHAKLMASAMEREDALRAGWVADTLADPGAALARFQQEVPPAEVTERLSSASMRVQGLSHWTDMGRVAFQMEMAGHMASQAGKSLDQVDEPLRSLLKSKGVSEAEWQDFTSHLFTAGNGATFASPMWWRESTTLPRAQADALFAKVQGLIEEQTEFAVPTQSLLARSYVDPAAYGIPPGSIAYEAIKSGTMFKSFAMTFSVNQYRRIAAMQTWSERATYGFNLAAGATIMGSISLQLAEIGKGNDPRDMSNPMFWAEASLKGGGFGIVGDIVATGNSSWGGGFGSYVSGPVPQMVGDAWDLTFKNAWVLANGGDPKLAEDLARMGKRYTPMGQTPLAGPAIDRLFWDQLQLFLDPESRQAMETKARKRQNLDGNASWWVPGATSPSRAPDLGQALGL